MEAPALLTQAIPADALEIAKEQARNALRKLERMLERSIGITLGIEDRRAQEGKRGELPPDLARAAGEIRRMAADAPQLAQTDAQLGLLLAAEAYRRDPGPVTLGALQRVFLETGGILGFLGGLPAIRVGPVQAAGGVDEGGRTGDGMSPSSTMRVRARSVAGDGTGTADSNALV